MEYMFLIHTDETAGPAEGSPEREAWMQTWYAYNQRLIDGGHFIAGGSLMPTATATTIRTPFGGPTTITDGPYLETKEQLGGYYVVRAADLDEALDLAAAIPLPAASIEVRPIATRPEA